MKGVACRLLEVAGLPELEHVRRGDGQGAKLERQNELQTEQKGMGTWH